MKKLSFILVLLSVLILSCLSPALLILNYIIFMVLSCLLKTIRRESREHLMYIQLASTNETRLYYCYETIADAKRYNNWIQNIEPWRRRYAIENPALDFNVKNIMIWWPFEVTATNLPDEHCYAINIYQNGKFYILKAYY